MTDDPVKEMDRLAMFQAGIAAITNTLPTRWTSYFSDYSIDENGEITFSPRVDRRDNDDLQQFFDYCRFLHGQGFTVEVALCASLEQLHLHLVSWESQDEPQWPEELQPVLLCRLLPRQ